MNQNVLRANSRRDLELERYFGKIKATFTRKAIVTTFDLLYLLAINLPIFVLFAYYSPSEGFIEAFHKLVERRQQIEAWRMCAYSVWICIVLYIYFVLIPSKTQYQTFFSSYLGMKAVTLDDNLNWKGRIKQSQLFRANLIPVFSIPIMCAIFFYCAWITNNEDWYDTLLKNGLRVFKNHSQLTPISYWIYGMRIVVVMVFFLQIHYLFTVGASAKALNWFTKSNKIIFVNVERALVVMSTEDKPAPNRSHPFDVTKPAWSEGTETEEEETEDDDSAIDFSRDIDMGTEDFLQQLKKEQSSKDSSNR